MYGYEPEEDPGKFEVEDYCFQQLPEQAPAPHLDQDRSVSSYNMVDKCTLYDYSRM